MAQTTRTRARMCLFGVCSHCSPFRGLKSPKHPYFGAWIGVFKPNSRQLTVFVLFYLCLLKINLNMLNVHYLLEIKNEDYKFSTHCGIRTRDPCGAKPWVDRSLYRSGGSRHGLGWAKPTIICITPRARAHPNFRILASVIQSPNEEICLFVPSVKRVQCLISAGTHGNLWTGVTRPQSPKSPSRSLSVFELQRNRMFELRTLKHLYW